MPNKNKTWKKMVSFRGSPVAKWWEVNQFYRLLKLLIKTFIVQYFSKIFFMVLFYLLCVRLKVFENQEIQYYRTTLFCAILYCIVLWYQMCTILCYHVLFCTVLYYRNVPCYTVSVKASFRVVPLVKATLAALTDVSVSTEEVCLPWWRRDARQAENMFCSNAVHYEKLSEYLLLNLLVSPVILPWTSVVETGAVPLQVWLSDRIQQMPANYSLITSTVWATAASCGRNHMVCIFLQITSVNIFHICHDFSNACFSTVEASVFSRFQWLPGGPLTTVDSLRQWQFYSVPFLWLSCTPDLYYYTILCCFIMYCTMELYYSIQYHVIQHHTVQCKTILLYSRPNILRSAVFFCAFIF